MHGDMRRPLQPVRFVDLMQTPAQVLIMSMLAHLQYG